MEGSKSVLLYLGPDIATTAINACLFKPYSGIYIYWPTLSTFDFVLVDIIISTVLFVMPSIKLSHANKTSPSCVLTSLTSDPIIYS